MQKHSFGISQSWIKLDIIIKGKDWLRLLKVQNWNNPGRVCDIKGNLKIQSGYNFEVRPQRTNLVQF